MIRKISGALVVALGCSLLIASVVLAKGPPAKVTISGPGLAAEVEITDPDVLLAFSFFQFENIDRGIETPQETGEGYIVTRYVVDAGKPIAWDRAIYYPGPQNEVGVVFLEGLIGTSATEFDGYWYQASPDGDAAMRKILSEHQALPTEEKPAARPAPTLLIVLGAVLALAVVGVLTPRLVRYARQRQV